MTMQWHGEEAMRQIVATTDERCGAAAVYLHGELLKVLSVSYPPASKPGEPPHGRTWNLRSKVVIDWTPGSGVARVGVLEAADYGAYLEIGTKTVASRPWFFSTLQRVMPVLEKILVGG